MPTQGGFAALAGLDSDSDSDGNATSKTRKKKNKQHFHYVRIVIQFLATWIIPRNRLERLNRANMVFWCTNLAYFAVLDLSFNKCMAYANKEAEYNP